MGRIVAVPVVALVALLVLTVMLALQQPDPAVRSVTAAPAPEPGEPAAAAPPPPAPASRGNGLDGAFWANSLFAARSDLAAADDRDPRAGVLRGRLTVRQQPWLHPAGVEVRLTRSWLDSVIPVESEPGAREPRRDELRTTTDQHGAFALRFVPPDDELFFLIGHGTEWSDYQPVPKLPRAGEDIDLGDVFVEQRGEIHGQVVAGSRPAAGVTVRVVDDPLLDDASGFEGLRQARQLGLDDWHVPGSTASGPLPDWVVRRDRFLPFPTATTDRDGRFRVRGVRPGNHDIHVRGDSRSSSVRASLAGILVAAGRTTNVGTLLANFDLRLLEVRFEDEQGRPWVGAEVAALAAATGLGDEVVRTDANGHALLARPRGPTILAFGLPGGGPWLRVASLDGNAADDVDAPRRRLDYEARSFVVPRPREIPVALIDEGNRTVTGGTVRSYVQAVQFRPVDRRLTAPLQPRDRGQGRFTAPLPCALLLVAHAPGFAPAVASIAADARDATLVMQPLRSITVRVRDLHGSAIAHAQVRAQVHGDRDSTIPGTHWAALANTRIAVGTTDERGELEVPVWATWFSFEASHRDYARSANRKLVPQPGERLDLLLRGGAAVHGDLRIAGRPAAAGLRVRARQRPPEGHELTDSGFLDERLAVVGTGGAFAFRRLAAGIWELRPELPAIPGTSGSRSMQTEWRTQRVQLDEGQELHTVLELQQDRLAAASITGVVTQNRTTVAGALVRARPLDDHAVHPVRPSGRRPRPSRDEPAAPDAGAPWLRCTTDAFGDFCFHDLLEGREYELRVDIAHGGRLQFVGRAVVRAGTLLHPTHADFAFSTGDLRLTCLQNGQPHGNRMVRLRQVVDGGAEGARFETLLGALGEAWIDGLPAGSWTVEPMHGGGRYEPAVLEVGAGRSTATIVTLLDR